MEPLPNLATLSDAELKALIDELTTKENEVSFHRRLLAGPDRHPARGAHCPMKAPNVSIVEVTDR